MLLFRRSKDVMRALRQNAAESYKLKRRRWLARRSRMIDTLIRNNVVRTAIRTNVVRSTARLSCHTC